MQRPISHVLITQRSPQRKAASVVAVGALHVALVLALLAGLAPPIITKVLPADISVIFQPEKQQAVQPPPPPTVTMTDATVDTTPMPPKWTVADTDRQITVARTDKPPVSTGPVAKILPTSAESLAGTHTTPPYPPLSRRLGEQGKVGLRILIAADGHIADVEIAASSGVERLDEAARDWVRTHWLYRPATREGKAVASQTEAVVVFDLKTAQR